MKHSLPRIHKCGMIGILSQMQKAKPVKRACLAFIISGLLACLLLLTSFTPVPSQAAFPGTNGKIAFTTQRDSNEEIYSMNPDGSSTVNLTNNSSADGEAAWSPDGVKIAFRSNRDGNHEIYVMNADGSAQTRLTNNSAIDMIPSWSPDGTKITFTSRRDGNDEIYVMNADGSNQINLTNNPGSDAIGRWSPDGSKIAFHSDRTGTAQIYVMNADGSNVTPLTNSLYGNGAPAWSPDGTKIAFYSVRDGTGSEIYVMNADGSNPTRLTNNTETDDSPAWSPDGTKIVFDSTRDGNYEIYVMNADGTSPTNLTNHPGVDLGPDWQTIPLATPTPSTTPTDTLTPTNTNSPAPTDTPTETPTPTNTFTPTNTPTATNTPIPLAGCSTPDTFGYTCADVSASFIPGTIPILAPCTNCAAGVGFPFQFTVYGQAFGGGTVTSNGSFLFAGGTVDPNNVSLPNTNFGPALFPYWDSLYAAIPSDGVYITTTGSAPNRTFVIEWRQHEIANGQFLNFEMQLHETTNQLTFLYNQSGSQGGSATSGIQDFNGQNGRYLQSSYNQAVLNQGRAIRFSPPPPTPTPTFTPTLVPQSSDIFVTDSNPGVDAIVRINRGTGAQSTIAQGPPLSDPVGIAASSDGFLYVADTQGGGGTGYIIKVNTATGAQTVLSSGGLLVDPYGITLASDGFLYVVDVNAFGGGGGVVRVDKSSGAQLPIAYGADFLEPVGIAAALNGDLYVVDVGVSSGIGTVLKVVPATGAVTVVTSGGILDDPFGVAIGWEGDLFVADAAATGTGAVIRVNSLTGEQTLVSSEIFFDNPRGVAVEVNGSLVVSDSDAYGFSTGGVVRVNPLTGSQTTLSSGNLLVNPWGIALVSPVGGTPTPTPTPMMSLTPTPSRTPRPTHTLTNTPTQTNTATPTSTSTIPPTPPPTQPPFCTLPSLMNPAIFGVGGNPVFVLPVDFNQDSRIDLVTANQTSNSISVLLGDGDGRLGTPLVFGTNSPLSATAGDLDQFGYFDLVTTSSNNSLVIWLGANPEKSTFNTIYTIPIGGQPAGVVIGDFNGDNKQDIAYARTDGLVFIRLGQGDGNFNSVSSVAGLPSSPTTAIAGGDFNLDGKLDLAAANGNYLSILLGNGSGGFSSVLNAQAGMLGQHIVAGDLNHDGQLDIVVEGGQSQFSVLLNMGGGILGTGVSYDAPEAIRFIGLEDLDLDGTLDVVTANGSTGHIAIIRGIGNGVFEPGILLNSGLTNPLALAFGRFNSDNIPDIVSASGTEVAISINICGLPTPTPTNTPTSTNTLTLTPTPTDTPTGTFTLPSDTTTLVWDETTNGMQSDWQSTGFNDTAWSNAIETPCDAFGSWMAPYSGGLWIWHPNCTQSNQFILLRKKFNLASTSYNGTVKIQVDDASEVYFNGSLLGQTAIWNNEYTFNLSPLFITGDNVLAIRARNTGGPGGVTFQIELSPNAPQPTFTPTLAPTPTATIAPGLCTAITSNNASQATTWNCGHVPLPGESILIPTGISVPFDVDLVDLQHVTIASGGTLKGDGVPHTLSLTGNFSNSGVLNPNGAMTVRFKGTGAQTLDGTGTSFFDLVIENNGGGVTFNSPATVLGTLNLRSDLTIAAPNLLQQEGASTGNGDVIGNVRHRVAGPNIPVSFGNPSVLLTFANQGTLPQDVTITLSKNAPGGLSNAVSRVYSISANGGSGYEATLQLHYTDAEVASAGANENSLQLFRHTGSTWSAQGGTVNASSDYVSLTGVTQFSNWAISGGAPTAATLVDFTVEPKGKVVKLRWITGSELNLIGFDVWRKVGKQEWKKLNKQLIPAINLGRVSGTNYVFNDVKVKPARTYRYRLELIKGNGENETSYEVRIKLP